MHTGSVNAFRRDGQGSVVIIFAISMTGLFGMAGLALDYNQWSREKQILQQAADHVALAAARKATDLTVQGLSQSEAQAAALEMAKALWQSSVGKVNAALEAPTIDLKNASGDSWSATLTYKAKMSTSIAAAIGIKSLGVNGKAEANLTMAMAYMDINFLLDTSQSMGLAATKAGMDQLVNLTGCMFGCHVAGQSQTYDAARANNIPMRVDVLRATTDKIIGEAIKTADASDQYRIGLYAFDNQLIEVAPPSTSLSTQRAAAAAIDLPTHHDGSLIDDALSKLNDKMTTSGNGSSSVSPKKFVFLVTDGVQDGIHVGWLPPGGMTTGAWGNTSAMQPTSCDALKAKGITVAVLYTTYVEFTGWWQFDDLVAPFKKDIAKNLEACASPDFFFQATSADEIDGKMMKMFTKSVEAAKGLRLTK